MPVNTLPVDSNSRPADGLFDPTTGHVIAAKSGTVATSGGGVEYAPAIVNIADPTTPANQLAVNSLGQIAISNFPATQSIIGTVSIAQFPSVQVVSGMVDVSDRAARQLGHVIVDLGGAGTNTAPGYSIIQDGVLNTRKMAVNADGSINIAGTITATNPSVGTNGATIPASSTMIGASDGTNLQQLLVETSLNRNLRVGIYNGAIEAIVTNANALKVDNSAVTQPVSGTITANIGTTNGLALDASVNGVIVAQASTTSGQKGPLIQGAVTTGSPSYTTAQTSPISLTTAGAVRVDASATTQPISGTITANQGGTWTVQPGNTANTTAWKVDNSGVTQPTNITQVLGATLSNTNPVLTEANLQNWLRNAQIFTVTTGAQAAGTQTSGACLFNASTGKSAYVFSVFVMNSNPGQAIYSSLRKVTSNPSYTNSATPVCTVLNSSNTSLMAATWQASASVTGTDIGTDNFNAGANSKDVLQVGQIVGRGFLLGNGANSGLAVYVGQGGTGGVWSVTFTYAEF
jgi:hypothetical protein